MRRVKFGLIYAGAQKNLGPSGVTIVIIREDLIGYAMDITPTMLDYKPMLIPILSIIRRPPMVSIFASWSLSGSKSRAAWQPYKSGTRIRRRILYDYLDRSQLFKGTVDKKDRSLMNVPFITGDSELDAKFVKAAAANGMVELKGHRSVGGMRASIYNAMPIEGVKRLVEFMEQFEKENSK